MRQLGVRVLTFKTRKVMLTELEKSRASISIQQSHGV